MDAHQNEQFYKMRIEDLEKQLDTRKTKMDNLCKELQSRSEELARQVEKHQSACETRDECKFKVVQLESEMKGLRTENEQLKSQLKEQKEVKHCRELSLEVVVESYKDQLQNYEEKLKKSEFKIAQLEMEKSITLSPSEKSFAKTVTISDDIFKVSHLENDIKLLSLENQDLKSRLEDEKERNNIKIQTLEAHIKLCADKLQKSEETIKEYESKMTNLEEALQTQLARHKVSEKQLEVEKITNAHLQKELEDLKSMCKKQFQAGTSGITKMMPKVGSVSKGVLKIQECNTVFMNFAEQQRNLQMKFEHEMREKLQDAMLLTENVPEVPKENSPVAMQDIGLQKALKTEALEVKEDFYKSTPLKPQNRRQQKPEKPVVKEAESQTTVKTPAARPVSEKIKTSRSTSALSTYSEASQLGYSTSTDSSVICPSFQTMKTNLKDELIELDEDISSVFSVWVSYAEIYNENIYDLLQQSNVRPNKPLLMGENDKREVYIKGLTEVCVQSAEEAYKVFMYGQHNLHQASTSVNHVSSRSHSIFSIKLVKHINVDFPTFTTLSSCTFVDLAGAERAKKTKNAGERMKESQSINTSLHVLGKCLEVLRHNQKNRDSRILPCRESKLTRLFQRALEGKEVLTMIVNINQDKELFDETINVLKFSAIAMELQFEKVQDTTVCSLRRSSFSLYMSKLSTTFHSSMGGIEEVPENDRYLKLLEYIEELKKNLQAEKNKNMTLEVQIRKEAYTHFRQIMLDMENSYKQRLKDEREAFAECEEINANLYQVYLKNAGKRSRNEDSDEEDEIEGDDDDDADDTDGDDDEEKIKFLQNKVTALTGLVEAADQLKVAHTTLQTKYSKLQFELATVKQELEAAVKINEATTQGEGEDASRESIRILKKQLIEQQNLLKEKNSEIEKMNKLLEDAKVEYDQHFQEHEDFAARSDELEKKVAERDIKIEDLEGKLDICNKKLSEQRQIMNDKELEDAEYTNKLHLVCEARDEYKFKVTQLECELKKLQKENEVLKSQPKSPNSNEVKALELLVASHEDQLKKYEEKFKNQEEASRLLEDELCHLKASSLCSNQDSYEKEISILQAEIKETAKGRKELMEKIENLSKELQESQEALRLAELALTEEQNNTKAMRRICESEKNDIILKIGHMQNEMKQLVNNCDKLEKENRDLKLLNMELEETVKVKEEQLEDFKARRNAQFETYENLLKHERELREREQREVHQMHNVMRALTPKKNEQLADIAKLKDKLKEANMKIAKLEKEKKPDLMYELCNKMERDISSKARARRQKKEQKENTSEDEIEPVSFPEIAIKPDPDSNRQLRPRRKKILYASEEEHQIDVGMMQKSTRRRPRVE